MNNRLRLLAFGLVAAMLLMFNPVRAEEIICPGSGERCAQVKFLFIKYWKMKEKGGPGIIIIEEE